MRKNLLLVLGLVLMCLAPREQAQAQLYTCGMRCEATCNIQYETGKMAVDGTSNPLAMHYWMGCQLGTACQACAETRRGGENDALAASLASAPTAALAEIARVNRERILVSLSRNLIVIRGTECNPDAFVAVSAISKARARQLAQLGIAELENVSPPTARKRGN